MKLYHGTCDEDAKEMLNNGWEPSKKSYGSNFGNPKYLYLTTHPLDAEWFANEKGCNIVLKVEVPISQLHVDPDDGLYAMEYWNAIKQNNKALAEEYFKKELNLKTPSKLVTDKPLPSKNFSLYQKNEERWI